MANEIKLSAESRSEFGKGAARRIRRDHKVPAVVYGHGTDPIHITLPGHETMLALRTANALLSIAVDGGKAVLALPKQIQRDPVKNVIEHVDLVIVRRGEKVTVDVPLHVVGEAAAETVVVTENPTIQLEAEATRIPEAIEVSVEGLEAGTQILASQLELPEGAAFHGDPELLIVNITQMISQEQLDAELEAAEAEIAEGKETEEPEEEAAEGESAEGEGEGAEGESEDGEKSDDAGEKSEQGDKSDQGKE